MRRFPSVDPRAAVGVGFIYLLERFFVWNVKLVWRLFLLALAAVLSLIYIMIFWELPVEKKESN